MCSYLHKGILGKFTGGIIKELSATTRGEGPEPHLELTDSNILKLSCFS